MPRPEPVSAAANTPQKDSIRINTRTNTLILRICFIVSPLSFQFASVKVPKRRRQSEIIGISNSANLIAPCFSRLTTRRAVNKTVPPARKHLRITKPVLANRHNPHLWFAPSERCGRRLTQQICNHLFTLYVFFSSVNRQRLSDRC